MTRTPYGIYMTDDGNVLFDRRYKPIARFRGGDDAPAMIVPAAHSNRPVVLPIGTVTPCRPDEWIEHHDKVWLFNDATAPSHNPATRDRIATLSTALAGLLRQAVPA